MSGCHSAALFGAGIGALAGQAIGGNTESTVAGAIYGGLIGSAVETGHTRHAGYYSYYDYPSYTSQHHHHVHRGPCYDY